jgi:hypothetical protein
LLLFHHGKSKEEDVPLGKQRNEHKTATIKKTAPSGNGLIFCSLKDQYSSS